MARGCHNRGQRKCFARGPCQSNASRGVISTPTVFEMMVIALLLVEIGKPDRFRMPASVSSPNWASHTPVEGLRLFHSVLQAPIAANQAGVPSSMAEDFKV
jgi:hypothetical protein